MIDGVSLEDTEWKMFDDYAAKFGLEKIEKYRVPMVKKTF